MPKQSVTTDELNRPRRPAVVDDVAPVPAMGQGPGVRVYGPGDPTGWPTAARTGTYRVNAEQFTYYCAGDPIPLSADYCEPAEGAPDAT